MALGILIGVALTVLVFIVGVGVLSRRRPDRRVLPDGFGTYVSGALMIAAAVALVVCIRPLSAWMASLDQNGQMALLFALALVTGGGGMIWVAIASRKLEATGGARAGSEGR